MKIHHVGYFVDDIQNAAREFEKLGFSRVGDITEDSSREIYVLFLENAGQAVELIQPVSKTSPMYGLRKNYRNSPYHICYEAVDLRIEIEKNDPIRICHDKAAAACPGDIGMPGRGVFDQQAYRHD